MNRLEAQMTPQTSVESGGNIQRIYKHFYKHFMADPESQVCIDSCVGHINSDPERRENVLKFAGFLDNAKPIELVRACGFLAKAAHQTPTSHLGVIAFYHIFDGPHGPTADSWKTLPERERLFWALVWMHMIGEVV